MTHLVMVQSPLVQSKHAYSSRRVPPLGCAYVAGALEAAGYRVSVIDALGEAPLKRTSTAHPDLIAWGLSIEEIVERIPEDAEGVGISVMFSQAWTHVKRLLREIRRRRPHLRTFAGGEHVTATGEYLIRSCPDLDVCVLGEGEETAGDLAAWIAGARSLDTIPGIVYRDGTEPRRTSARPRIRAIEYIPRPAWHLFPIDNYFAHELGHGVHRGRSLPMLATRGCPYQCTFCSSPGTWTTRYYVRPVEDVVDEIEDYHRRFGVTNIDFEDLTAFIKREWILDLCRELKRRGLPITIQIPAGTRSEALDAEVLAALYDSGLRNVTYAPESGSAEVLRRIKKKVNLEHIVESARAAHALGIVVTTNIIIGFPFETRQQVHQTLAYCLRLAWNGVEFVSIHPFCPYPGTAIYEELRREAVLPPLSDEYLDSLGYMDATRPSSVCKAIPAHELNVYRVGGMIGMFAIGYLRYPRRILRTARAMLTGTCDTPLEEKFSGWSNRLRLARARRRGRRSGWKATTLAGEIS